MVGRLESGRLLLDLRTVTAELDDAELTQRIERAVAAREGRRCT
jgi:hypothetical protein